MNLQPISNFDERMRDYKRERASFFLREVPVMFALFLVLSLGMFYGIDRLFGPVDTDWRALAVSFALFALVPPVWLMKPVRPSPRDVFLDQALRRAAGMDDSLSK